MGRHALLQGIFPTQGSNLGLPHCRQILHQLSDQANPTPSLYCQVNGGSGSDPRPAGLEGGPGDTGHHLDPVGCWGVRPACSLDTAPDRASPTVNISLRAPPPLPGAEGPGACFSIGTEERCILSPSAAVASQFITDEGQSYREEFCEQRHQFPMSQRHDEGERS